MADNALRSKLAKGKAMASEADMAEVERMIKAFYKFAAVDIPFELKINESVAAVFGEMLEATKKCSKAFGWIPQTAAMPPTILWLATNLGRGVLDHYLPRLSMTCARGAALSYRSRLEMASSGIALVTRNEAWA